MLVSERKIIIVEDEGLIAADLQAQLQRAGYNVPAIADCGTEAMRVIREVSPDLVLMDIRIKGEQDGIEVAERVRRDFDVPVVFLTSHDDSLTLARATQSQPFGYIKKPFAQASLTGSIETALAKHKFERYLKEQRDWFSASFAAVPDAIIVTDGLGRICYLNAVAEKLTGWSVEEALNVPSTQVLTLFDEKNGRTIEDFVPVALLQNQTTPLPAGISMRDRHGCVYGVKGSIAPKYRDGRADGTVILFQDVTLSRFDEKLVKQDATQGTLIRMADGLSRHLDLELSVVADESARLLDSLAIDSPLRQAAETIEKAALDAFAVSGRLQAFARQPNIRMRVIRINEVLEPLETAWKQLIPNFTLTCDPHPRPVKADPWQMTRALVTILLHTRNLMEEGTPVTLTVSRPEVESMREWVRIRLKYTVRHEEAAMLECALEPSWNTDTEELATAYRRIREMDGLFTVKEENDEVTIEIFLAQVEDEAAPPPVPALQQPAILLVEPNPEVRRVLHAHFSRHGYNLLETNSCDEALMLARLYEGPIPLAIARPGERDWARAQLTTDLAAIRPEMSVRLLAGYWEEAPLAENAAIESSSWYLNKWDLLDWANRAIVKAIRSHSEVSA